MPDAIAANRLADAAVAFQRFDEHRCGEAFLPFRRAGAAPALDGRSAGSASA